MEYPLSVEQMHQAIQSQYKELFVQCVYERQNGNVPMMAFDHLSLTFECGKESVFFSALLASNEVEEIVKTCFFEILPSAEQMEQALASKYRVLFADILRARLLRQDNVSFVKEKKIEERPSKEGEVQEIQDENLAPVGAATSETLCSSFEEVEEVEQGENSALPRLFISATSSELAEDNDGCSNQMDEDLPAVYLMNIVHCKAFNLPENDPSSGAVRNTLKRIMRDLQSRNIYLVGQIVGKNARELSLDKPSFELMRKNLLRCDGVDVELSIPGLDEAINTVALPIIAKKNVDAQEKAYSEEVQNNEHKKQKAFLMPLEEVPCFNHGGALYKSFSRAGKNKMTRLLGKLKKIDAKKLNDVSDLVDKEAFKVWFPEDENETYYTLFCKVMNDPCGVSF